VIALLRRPSSYVAVVLLIAAAHAPAIAMAQASDGLTEAEQRGKRIYRQGETESGRPVTVWLGRGGGELPASVVPCGGCHGRDGLGRPEGGLEPPDITWSTLTASYGHEHDFGRVHPPFDDETFARAIADGADPAGNVLDNAMPRYRMADEDLADLLAYIKAIDSDLDAGIGESTVRIGTLLPTSGQLAPLGNAMRSVLEAYFADINAGGGINGRTIELVVAPYDQDATEAIWQLRDLVRNQSVFALVSGYVEGLEGEVAALAEEAGIPLVGPMTPVPVQATGIDQYSFHLFAGLQDQAAVLAQFLHTSSAQTDGAAIVYRDTGRYTEFAEAAAAVAGQWSDVRRFPYGQAPFDARRIASAVESSQSEAVFFFGSPDEFRDFAVAADAAGYRPMLLTPGVLAARTMFDIPGGFAGKAFVAYPSVPEDHSPEGVAEFESLHERHGLGYEYSNAQLSAYGAAVVLLEGLKRSGRLLTRDRFVASLEGLNDFHTGLTPPISYNPTRRIGALGGYVLALDPGARRLSRTGSWIDVSR